MIASSDSACVIRLLADRSTFFWQMQTSLLFKLSINSLFEVFVSRTIQQSNTSTLRRFVSLNTDQQESTASILLRSSIYKAVSNKQTRAETSYFTQSVSRSKSISNLTLLSCQQSTSISFEQSSEYVHVITFESFEFRFLSSCFSFESLTSLLSIIDLSFHDNVIKSSWLQSVQLI